MPYPHNYQRSHDLEREEASGEMPGGSLVQAELAYIQEAMQDLNQFVRRFTTTDAKLNPLESVYDADILQSQSTTVVIPGTTVFPAAGPFNPTDDYVRVFLNEVALEASQFTADGTNITIIDGGVSTAADDVVEVRTYLGLRLAMESAVQYLATDQGAQHIGTADANGVYASLSVEEQLQEVMLLLVDTRAAFGARAEYLLRDGSTTLRDNWLVNNRGNNSAEGSQATGQFTLAAANNANGSKISISDGVNSSTFYFTDGGPAGAGEVAVAIGSDVFATANAFVELLEVTGTAISATVTDSGGNALVSLTANVPGTLGNQAITVDADPNSQLSGVVGMSGGTDDSTLPPLSSMFRIRNLPPAIRNGDPVTLEQLQQYAQVLAAPSTSNIYLKVDGSRPMVGPLNMGNNRLIGLADPANGGDAVNADWLAARYLYRESIADTGSFDAQYEMIRNLRPAEHGDAAAQWGQVHAIFLPRHNYDAASDNWDAQDSIIQGVLDPTDPDHAANKTYVDQAEADAKSYADGLVGALPGINAPTILGANYKLATFVFDNAPGGLNTSLNLSIPDGTLLNVTGLGNPEVIDGRGLIGSLSLYADKGTGTRDFIDLCVYRIERVGSNIEIHFTIVAFEETTPASPITFPVDGANHTLFDLDNGDSGSCYARLTALATAVGGSGADITLGINLFSNTTADSAAARFAFQASVVEK